MRSENELPENIDEYESFENISDSDSENIFENSSLLNSSFDGEFDPYFSSSTSASIFAWITKHMISTNAYEDLIKILNHPNFDIKNVPTNIRNFKETNRNQLPLLTIKKHIIPISDMKTQSTSQPRVSKMYNGLGIEIENKSEFWHGELWQQSPLFGKHSIIINSDLYYDDFGTYRNVYHSLGGVYIQIGNMPFLMRKLLKNHFVIGFVPFGGKFKDFIRPFLKELKELEKGKIINIQGKDTLVVAGLSLVTADLPQGNDLAGVMRHNAKKGCRFCMIEEHESLKFFDDLSKELHYHQLMDCEFENILSSNSLTEQKVLCSELGLKNQKSVLDDLMFDRLLQTPHDIYHAIAENLSVNSGLVINRLIQCWAIVAKCARFCFNLSFNDESYETLNSLLKQEITLLTKMFPQNFTHLPNLHINAHLQCHAKTFATLVNSAVGIKEMVHRTFKGAVPHTNGKMIERDLIKRYNTLQALRNIIDGMLNSRYNTGKRILSKQHF
ncbi:hypothetical protein C1646_796184 [Rhizophagus diaphanus]|nr:hypothetical protein C1646_796184 [Rhizophagus diaphanus] [Rhizophagus sp. MUCL 43196]